MPATRTTDQAIPAVSGSSGRLVVVPSAPPATPSYPGVVFGDTTLTYRAQIRTYATATHDRYAWRNKHAPDPDAVRVNRRAINHDARALQVARRSVRQQRQREDEAWMQVADARRTAQEHLRRAIVRDYAAECAADQHWRFMRDQRRAHVAQRKVDDQVWRAERVHIRKALAQTTVTSDWYAILLITDNCTRQCRQLPVFLQGNTVTSDQVIAALRQHLPPQVEFVISDRGTHFTAHEFGRFAHDHGFIHVPISRRRPQTNGIVERMVRTLKAWLRHVTWQSIGDLEGHLTAFLADYNDRPHQGLPNDLSPKEYARRLMQNEQAVQRVVD